MAEHATAAEATSGLGHQEEEHLGAHRTDLIGCVDRITSLERERELVVANHRAIGRTACKTRRSAVCGGDLH